MTSRVLLASFALFTLSGCATLSHLGAGKTGTDSNAASASATPSSGGLTLNEVLKKNSEPHPSAQANPPVKTLAHPTSVPGVVVRGVRLQNTEFDYPLTVNSAVEHWIDYFTGRGRKHFTRYLERSEFFIPYIRPLLKQNGMPEDLVYLAMIESGFNNLARSHAKAVGPWQFISATGRRYGLTVNWWLDERRDIRKSTLAAVGYLRDLYTMFGSWELAAASYNAGEAKVARAIQRYGTKDFWALTKHRYLRSETRNYVPKIIAAAIIAKNRVQFGFPPSAQGPSSGELIAGDGEVVKVVKTDRPLEDHENDKNPSVVEALDQGTSDEMGDEWLADDEEPAPVLNARPALAHPVPTPHMTKDGQVGGESLAEFEVQSPADLLQVARAAGISYFTVKALNPELLRWCTPPTVGSFRLHLPASVKERFLLAYNQEGFPKKVDFMTYQVKKGETLAQIASHYGIKLDPLTDLNSVSARMRLRKGARVVLPMPNDRSRSFSSLEVRDPPESKRRRRARKGRQYRVTYKKRESARSRTSALTDQT